MTETEHVVEQLRLRVSSLETNLAQIRETVRDHADRFDTLQTPIWKRMWFRIDGWPGQTNLNADRRAWRPWRRG